VEETPNVDGEPRGEPDAAVRAPSRRALLSWLVAGALVAASAGAGWAAAQRSDAAPGASSVDVGFLRDMSDHHDQAVQLSLLVLANGESAALKGFATDTIASQRYEIGLMDARLQDWGHGRGSSSRPAMAWMGHPTAVEEMPGMASAADLAALAAARGGEADALFVRLMVEHHEGGIHMAQHAWRHAERAVVRDLAEVIAKVQRIEIRDLLRTRDALGLPAA
jgi:uncharacterized protein (DUF305 family)